MPRSPVSATLNRIEVFVPRQKFQPSPLSSPGRELARAQAAVCLKVLSGVQAELAKPEPPPKWILDRVQRVSQELNLVNSYLEAVQRRSAR